MSSETENFIVVTSDAPAPPEADATATVATAATEGRAENKAPTTATDADADSAPADTGDTDTPADTAATAHKPKRSAQKRINKAIAQKAAAENKAAELERANAKLQAELESLKTSQPEVDDFDDYDDYLDAREAYDSASRSTKAAIKKAEEAEQAAADAPPADVSTALEVIKTAIEEADDLPADFNDLVYADDLALTPDMLKSISASDNPRELLYAIAKDKAKAAEIAGLDGIEQMRAIFALEFASQTVPAPKPSTASRAPAPITPVSTNSEPPRKSVHDMNYTEYEAHMNAKAERF